MCSPVNVPTYYTACFPLRCSRSSYLACFIGFYYYINRDYKYLTSKIIIFNIFLIYFCCVFV